MTGKNEAVAIVKERRAQVVEKVLSDMRKDGLRWSEPWLPSLSPHNPVTGTVYSGGNRLHLGFAAYRNGYDENRWCTFNQINNNGWRLKQGAKGVLIERWMQFRASDADGQDAESEAVRTFPRLVGYWKVFNASEVIGMPPEANMQEHVSDRTAETARVLKASSRCPVLESSRHLGSAAYFPAIDTIKIAPKKTFKSDESFTRTLLHEMCHSTGHPAALDRGLSTHFGSPKYAAEELVAELGSLFLSIDLGIQNDKMEDSFYYNHVAYLDSWMRALSDDPSYLFKAASKASRAEAYIMERYNRTLASERQTQDNPR